MAFEDRFNRTQTPFQLGAPIAFNLNPGSNILYGHVIIDATITISGSTAAGTVIGEGGVFNLIKEIRVVANKAAGSRYPNGTLVKCTPQDLVRYAIVERSGKFFSTTSGDATLGGGVNGSYPVYFDIPIYFADSINLNNVQTALNMNPFDTTGAPVYSNVQVQIDVASSIADVFNGNNGTLAVSGWIQWKDDRVQLASDSLPLIQEGHYQYIQNANTDLVDASMPNNGLFTQWMILAQSGSPGWQLSNALLNKLQLQGSSINFKEYASDIQTEMLNAGFYDPSQTLTGQYMIDFTHGLPVQNSNPAAGLNHQLDVNNPSGAGNDRLRVYTRRLMPLTPAAVKKAA